jgi:hypothetical protein
MDVLMEPTASIGTQGAPEFQIERVAEQQRAWALADVTERGREASRQLAPTDHLGQVFPGCLRGEKRLSAATPLR